MGSVGSVVAVLGGLPTSASTTRSRRLLREPFTSTHTSRVSSALTARASASVSANHSPPAPKASTASARELAGGEQAVDAVIAGEAPDVLMALIGVVAELAHVANDQPATRIAPTTTLDARLHRAGVRVVGVVDDPGTTGRGFQLQSARNRAHCGKARAHVVQRRAGRRGRRGGAQRVQHIVLARQAQLDRHRALRRHAARARDEAAGIDDGVRFLRRESAASQCRRWTMRARVMPRHRSANASSALITAVARHRDPRPFRLRRAPRLPGCRSLPGVPRRHW